MPVGKGVISTVESHRVLLGSANFLTTQGLAGIFAIADPVKSTTLAALERLRAEGTVEAEVLPDHKSDVVNRLRAEGHVVAMAGDGVNDAPALAAADVGIAMSSGTGVAMQSAGVTLLKGDLTGIVRARHLSRATMSNIRQSLVFAFIYNVSVIADTLRLRSAHGAVPNPAPHTALQHG